MPRPKTIAEVKAYIKKSFPNLSPKQQQEMVEMTWKSINRKIKKRTPEEEKIFRSELNHEIENPKIYKLTRTNQKNITKDWSKQLPEMGIDKVISSMAIMRRVGPIMIGIQLTKEFAGTRDSYRPVLFIHSLLKLNDGISGIVWSFPGSECKELKDRKACNIPVVEHKDKYLRAIEIIKNAELIPVEGPLTLKQVIKPFDNINTPELYDTTAAIYAWAGEKKLAQKYAELFLEYAKNIKLQHLIDELKDRTTYLHSFIKNPEIVRQMVKNEVIKHNLEHIPYEDIIDSPYKEID